MLRERDPISWNLLWMQMSHHEARYQFHQHFTCTFFVRKFVQSKTLSREKTYIQKCARKMLMKLTQGDGMTDAAIREVISTCKIRVELLTSKFIMSTLKIAF